MPVPFKSLIAGIVSVAVTGLLTAAPAIALTDATVDTGTATMSAGRRDRSGVVQLADQTAASDDAMPENPEAKLPSQVSEAIGDDATVVAQRLAVSVDGEIKDIETGASVTDPSLVGTVDTPADPLTKTDGQSFIPVEAAAVKDAVAANGGDVNAKPQDTEMPDAQAQEERSQDAVDESVGGSGQAGSPLDGDSAGEGVAGALDHAAVSGSASQSAYRESANPIVRVVALQNKNGAYWGTYNGTPAFFQGNGHLFAQQARGVIDVSEHNGDIDWKLVKDSGVEGAIIRLGYGVDNVDKKARRNINECRRLGIPFGIYWYSYAYDASYAAEEGDSLSGTMRDLGVSNGDLAYPAYYDLERWTWAGHKPPTSPNVYEGIVNNWYSRMKANGYTNLSVYSYTDYLNGPLDSASIHVKVSWIAQYNDRMTFENLSSNFRGWQYSSQGSVKGIPGRVDLNAFGYGEYEATIQMTWVVREEDVAIGAAVGYFSDNLEYKWQSYDLSAKKWKKITDWNGSNWASWRDNKGDYWLHLEVHDSLTKALVGSSTIAFAYHPGTTRNTGTYSGWEGNRVLLGESSNNPHARYEMKIYDVSRKRWVKGFKGQWAYWAPQKGIYWTHYEVYTSDNRLADTKTYAFGVS